MTVERASGGRTVEKNLRGVSRWTVNDSSDNPATHHQAAAGQSGASDPNPRISGKRNVSVVLGSHKNLPRKSAAMVPLSPPAGGKKTV